MSNLSKRDIIGKEDSTMLIQFLAVEETPLLAMNKAWTIVTLAAVIGVLGILVHCRIFEILFRCCYFSLTSYEQLFGTTK
jgi:hypothetical protein